MHTSTDVTAAIHAAVQRRLEDEALADLQHLRLFDGGSEGIPGLFIERFGPAEDRRYRITGPPALADQEAAIFEALGRPEAAYWRFGHDHTWGPDDGQMVVEEYGLRYHVRLIGQRNAGLFPQVRPARRWLRDHAADRRILNLFAYTCAFGVVAEAHGARGTVNVDTSAGVLARGEENYQLNEISADRRAFWREGVKEALKQLRKRGRRFDGVIIDPPPRAVFDKGKRWRFDPARDLAPTIQASAALLDPGGWLLVVNAGARITDEAIIEAAGLGAPDTCLSLDGDCPTPPDRPEISMQIFTAPA